MCSLRIWGRSKLSTIAWPQSIAGSNCIAEEFKELVSSYSKLFLNSMFSSNIWCVKKPPISLSLFSEANYAPLFLIIIVLCLKEFRIEKSPENTRDELLLSLWICSVIRILINQQTYYQNYLENGKCRMTVVIVYLNEQHIGNNHKLLLS